MNFIVNGFVFFQQTRSLLGVFEEDTAAMSNYCTQLYQAMQRIYDAQVHTLFSGVFVSWEVVAIAKVFLKLLSAVCCFLFKNELSAATHLTSRLLKEYDKQVGQDISRKPQDSSSQP